MGSYTNLCAYLRHCHSKYQLEKTIAGQWNKHVFNQLTSKPFVSKRHLKITEFKFDVVMVSRRVVKETLSAIVSAFRILLYDPFRIENSPFHSNNNDI